MGQLSHDLSRSTSSLPPPKGASSCQLWLEDCVHVDFKEVQFLTGAGVWTQDQSLVPLWREQLVDTTLGCRGTNCDVMLTFTQGFCPLVWLYIKTRTPIVCMFSFAAEKVLVLKKMKESAKFCCSEAVTGDNGHHLINTWASTFESPKKILWCLHYHLWKDVGWKQKKVQKLALFVTERKTSDSIPPSTTTLVHNEVLVVLCFLSWGPASKSCSGCWRTLWMSLASGWKTSKTCMKSPITWVSLIFIPQRCLFLKRFTHFPPFSVFIHFSNFHSSTFFVSLQMIKKINYGGHQGVFALWVSKWSLGRVTPHPPTPKHKPNKSRTQGKHFWWEAQL